jgi:hypothetical protein
MWDRKQQEISFLGKVAIKGEDFGCFWEEIVEQNQIIDEFRPAAREGREGLWIPC